MEYTTPASYNNTVVNVGGIVKDDEIVYAGVTNSVTHTESTQDAESDWPEPTSIKWVWDGNTSDMKDVHAEVDGPLGKRLDRVDVMAEVPGFIKTIAGSVAGTRPYIFQVSQVSSGQVTQLIPLVLPTRPALPQAEDGRHRDDRGGPHVLRGHLHFLICGLYLLNSTYINHYSGLWRSSAAGFHSLMLFISPMPNIHG